MFRRSSLVIPFVMASSVVALRGQDRPAGPRDTLARVVITATRVPFATVAPTATTTVLDGNMLRAAGIVRAVDALRLVPGADVVSSGAIGSQTSLFLRGGNSNYVRVLIDGVAVNDAGGAFDFAGLTTDNVDRIEVVRGPASVLYGSDAVTGVVQIFTKNGTGPFAVRAAVDAGSYGARREELGFSGGTRTSGFTLAGAHDATDGFLAFNNRYTNDVMSAALRFAPDAQTDVHLATRWTSSSFHFPTDYTGAVVDRNSEQSDHRFVASLDAGRRLTRLAEFRVSLTSNEYLPRSNDGPDGPADTLDFYGFFSRAVRTQRTVDTRLNLRYARRGIFTVGAEIAADRERSSSLSLSQFGADSGGFSADRHNTGWYAQAVGDATDRFSYSVGGRVDDNSAFGTFPTMRASAAYATSASTRLRASIGSAFNAPSFFENFSTGFVTGNPALRPEHSRSAEIGFDAITADGMLTVKTTGYIQAFHDIIQYNGSAAAGAPNYFNVAAASANGIEVEADYRPVTDISFAARYAWTDTRVTQAGFDKTAGADYVVGDKLIRRPPHLLTVMATQLYRGGGSVYVIATRVGERDDRDFAAFPVTTLVLPAYTKVDVAVQMPLRRTSPNLMLTARIENAFDAKYQEIVRFAAPGRLVFVGLRMGK